MNLVVYGLMVALGAYSGMVLGRGTVCIALHKSISLRHGNEQLLKKVASSVEHVIGRSCVALTTVCLMVGVQAYKYTYYEKSVPFWGKCYGCAVISGVVSAIYAALRTEKQIISNGRKVRVYE
jgi:hypothetical protein